MPGASGFGPRSVADRSLALVGCGRWGRHVLRDLIELGAAVAVADPSPDARAHARAAGAASVVADPCELPDVAGAVVATPTATHAAVIETLLARAVPIFCEKPLTADVAEAAELAARAADRLFVMDKWRYHPGVECLRDLARCGELGGVRGVRTLRHGWMNAHRDVDAVWILAPHDLSIVIEILGRLPEASAAVGERREGRACALRALLGDEPWAAIDIAATSPVLHREVRLYAEHGVAVLPDAYSDAVHVLRPGAAADRRAVSVEPPLRRELQHFLAYLAGGAPPKSRAADGLAVVAMLHRLRAMAGLDGGRSR